MSRVYGIVALIKSMIKYKITRGVKEPYKVSYISRAMIILDLGCGKNKWSEYKDVSIGIDRVHVNGVDVVADLSRGIPIRDSSIDKIIAFSIIEHLRDLITFIGECHRILKKYYTMNF